MNFETTVNWKWKNSQFIMFYFRKYMAFSNLNQKVNKTALWHKILKQFVYSLSNILYIILLLLWILFISYNYNNMI